MHPALSWDDDDDDDDDDNADNDDRASKWYNVWEVDYYQNALMRRGHGNPGLLST